MSGFVASGPAVGGHINTDPFWPSIDLDHVRAVMRIDASVTVARLETAVIAAAITINRELAPWRQIQKSAGYPSLVEVPAGKFKGISEKVHLYLRAIHVATAAEICERYRNFDSTSAGHQNADELTPTVDEYRRDQRWAIRDFLGLNRSTVELI